MLILAVSAFRSTSGVPRPKQGTRDSAHRTLQHS